MVAVRLSAQCTDARVNEVTPSLFAAYPTLEALAEADISHVEELVHSCGFYKNKAREIVLACRMLLTDYGGKVPGTMEELLKLPGVGRKTANLLLGDLYNAPGAGAIACFPGHRNAVFPRSSGYAAGGIFFKKVLIFEPIGWDCWLFAGCPLTICRIPPIILTLMRCS